MGITVNQLYTNSKYRSQIKIIGGNNGLDRIVKYIAVMEVTDFADKCKGDELFVLTTFSFCNGNEDYINNIFEKLIDKNISAIAIKINRFIANIPDELVKTANKNNTPLFVLEEGVLFSELISDLNSIIINQQFNIINQLNEQHELLYNAILHGETLDRFLKRMGKILKSNCYCFLLTGKIISKYLVNNKTKYNENDIALLIEDILKKNMNKDLDLEKPTFIKTTIGNFYIHPCIARNKILGFFIIQSKDTMSDIDIMLSHQMNSFLSIKMLESQLESEVKNRLKSETMNEILLNFNSNELIIKEKLNSIGLSPMEKYFIMIIDPNYQSKENKNINDDIYGIRIIKKTIQRYSKDIIAMPFLDYFILIVSFNSSNKLNNISELRVLFEELDNNDIIQSKFKIASSRIESDYTLLSQIYTGTRKTLDYGKYFSPLKTFYIYDDFISIRMIAKLMDTDEYKTIYNDIIKPLIEYDKKNNTKMLDTLKACIVNETLDGAAKELFVHINTLRYRLEKIKELTNVNYFSGEGKYLLTNAYYFNEIRQIN